MKDFSNKLTVAGDNIKDSGLVFYTVDGLPPEHNTCKPIMRMRGYLIDFDELSSLLKAKEINILKNNSHVHTTESTILTIQFNFQSLLHHTKGGSRPFRPQGR